MMTNVPSESSQPTLSDRPDGPAAAAFVAAGIGGATLGLMTTLAEASESIKEWLQFNDDVGPVSGKTIVSVIVWAISWVVLTVLLAKRSEGVLRWAIPLTVALIAFGWIGTFPKFFELFAPE